MPPGPKGEWLRLPWRLRRRLRPLPPGPPPLLPPERLLLRRRRREALRSLGLPLRLLPGLLLLRERLRDRLLPLRLPERLLLPPRWRCRLRRLVLLLLRLLLGDGLQPRL